MKKILLIQLFLLFLSSCIPNQQAPLPDERTFLIDQYFDFTDLYDELIASPGSGADVEKAYDRCQIIITKIADSNISEPNQEMAAKLLTGLIKYCTGFGCYSNKSLCKDDNEATKLIFQGKQLLDDFYDNIK